MLSLELDSNATTGYSWEMTFPENGKVIKGFGKPRYVQKSELVGAGGFQLFRFHPVKKGTAVLKFEYKRSWETGIKPAKTYVVRVIVN
jgi:predicted secreted protein